MGVYLFQNSYFYSLNSLWRTACLFNELKFKSGSLTGPSSPTTDAELLSISKWGELRERRAGDSPNCIMRKGTHGIWGNACGAQGNCDFEYSILIFIVRYKRLQHFSVQALSPRLPCIILDRLCISYFFLIWFLWKVYICSWSALFLASCCCSVVKSHLTFCDPMNCSMPGSSVLSFLPECAQIHVRGVSDVI